MGEKSYHILLLQLTKVQFKAKIIAQWTHHIQSRKKSKIVEANTNMKDEKLTNKPNKKKVHLLKLILVKINYMISKQKSHKIFQ